MSTATATQVVSTEMAPLRHQIPSLEELPLLLRQIPDIVLEIASHLPTESAMCLALACKPLYGLLFGRARRKMEEDGSCAPFLFFLLKDLRRTHKGIYLCHFCTKLHRWRCRDGGLGWCPCCPTIGEELSNAKHAGDQEHACITDRSYFTYTFRGVECNGDFSRWVMHRQRGGFRSCCGWRPSHTANHSQPSTG
ncbi:hypothetical protein CSHISOI_06652 [Colletotrichum shisoi]|uniref:F-box domain-containing protein n=1 Tax=Colletotrichum shisoi TaxID=2078593 RepID=A0A5Q4BQ55_9PEZI|nr:hypothetical protein CSHISOI_06652 [Colletotrichum shisoi]